MFHSIYNRIDSSLWLFPSQFRYTIFSYQQHFFHLFSLLHPIFNITSCEQYEVFVEKIGKTWNEIQVPHDTQHFQNVNIIFFSCSLMWKKIHCKSKYYLCVDDYVMQNIHCTSNDFWCNQKNRNFRSIRKLLMMMMMIASKARLQLFQ